MEQNRAGPGLTDVPAACRWCGMMHGPRCPSVRAMEFDVYGNLLRVEFFPPGELAVESHAAPQYPRKGNS